MTEATRLLELAALPLLLLASSCVKIEDEPRFVCWRDGEAYSATAVFDMNGAVRRYFAKDRNGIAFDIDERNSAQFSCLRARAAQGGEA